MRTIQWNETGRRFYETGIDRCVLYPTYGYLGLLWSDGVAWNGLLSVDETPSGGELSSYYYDGIKYMDYVESEDYEASISAYTYPDEFDPCEGNAPLSSGIYATRQRRQPFSLCYRSLIGSDTDRAGKDYKLHLVYNVITQPSGKSRKSLSAAVDPMTFQWTITGVPIINPSPFNTQKPTSHYVIDTRRVDRDKLDVIESYLYGYTPDDDVIDGGSPGFTSPDVLDGGIPGGIDIGLVDGGTAATSTTIPPSLLPPYVINQFLN